MAACMATAPTTFGESGLLAVGRCRPDDLVQPDQVDGAPSGQERVARLEHRPRTDQRTGAEGRIELVAAEGHEVRRRREGTVGRQLGTVDQHCDAPVVGGGDDGVDGRQPARHVGGTGDGQQRRWASARVQCGDHVLDA